jgi:sec-independent protein translocase protein TatA
MAVPTPDGRRASPPDTISDTMSTLAFLPGPGELWIVLVVVLVIFGGKKLPELARAMGSSITQFKHGLKDESDSATRIAGSDESPTEGSEKE